MDLIQLIRWQKQNQKDLLGLKSQPTDYQPDTMYHNHYTKEPTVS